MENQDIVQRLDKIEKEMQEMKKLIVNIEFDSVLSEDEEARLEESLKDLEEGRAISLEEIKKDRENA